VIRVSTAKDETDLELAVQSALERYGAPLTLTCAFTERMDHTLAAFGALLSAGRGAMVREPSWSAWVVLPDSPVSLALEAGRRFSVLAGMPSSGVTVSGGRWKLDRADLPPLSGRGVSNVATGGNVDVSCCGGALLVLLCEQA
jgi:thiamine pyrophosphokinase